MPRASPVHTNHMAAVLIKALYTHTLTKTHTSPLLIWSFGILYAVKCSYTNGAGFMTNCDFGNERLKINTTVGWWLTLVALKNLWTRSLSKVKSNWISGCVSHVQAMFSSNIVRWIKRWNFKTKFFFFLSDQDNQETLQESVQTPITDPNYICFTMILVTNYV